ncbi:MAG: DUF3368 domain-containing protein [Limnoraphis robusta]|uniref:Twitching motility protein PilT n=1 Tax=Limnoraphis robusta CS-951 TaxID=1637645 RepID=A0A0F5YIC9_9CYAN|nr:DUF3368 domain-containing protein [Limnoraphis robusta]KKD37955.1 twitching motility protein PilT [Limnoraphis robusta CS-951]
MLIEKVIINTSPLIVLFKSELIDLLPRLFTEIWVPEAVWCEVVEAGKTDAASKQLPTVSWVKRVSVATISPRISSWGLDAGESEVLSLTLENPDYRAIIDDAAARRVARTLEIPVLGTVGILLLAKKRGLIPSVTIPIQALRDAGLWLADEFVQSLLRQTGEL